MPQYDKNTQGDAKGAGAPNLPAKKAVNIILWGFIALIVLSLLAIIVIIFIKWNGNLRSKIAGLFLVLSISLGSLGYFYSISYDIYTTGRSQEEIDVLLGSRKVIGYNFLLFPPKIVSEIIVYFFMPFKKFNPKLSRSLWALRIGILFTILFFYFALT